MGGINAVLLNLSCSSLLSKNLQASLDKPKAGQAAHDINWGISQGCDHFSVATLKQIGTDNRNSHNEYLAKFYTQIKQ